MTEQELAAHVVAYLKTEGWDVYQEVQANWGSSVADIVAVRGEDLSVIEVKKSLTAALVEQAWLWKKHANYVYIAVPAVQRHVRGRSVMQRFCFHEGIGILVQASSWEKQKVRVELEPKRGEITLGRLRESLREEHKTFCKAGSAGGGHFTMFKRTCLAWRKYVETHPGCTLKEAGEVAGHHYASLKSACASMPSMIEAGHVPGLRVDRSGRSIRLFPKTGSDAGT